MRHLLPLLCLGCSPELGKLPSASDFRWGGDGGDSGESDTADSGDTGEVEDPPQTDDPIECVDPSRRDSVGRFEAFAMPDIPLQEFDIEPDMTNASGIAVGDMDGDGRLDILLPHAGPAQLLMQQEDGSFVDETELRWDGLTDGAQGAVAIQVVDIDGDADLDVFMCGGPVMGEEPRAVYNQLFLNDGAGNLSNVSAAWGLESQDIRACYGASFGDIDGDGDLDMAMAGNQACPYDIELEAQDCDLLLEQESSQVLWENTGSSFVDISDRLPHLELLSSFTHVATLLDVDGDHDLDLYMVNDDKLEVEFSATNLLYLNDGGGIFTPDDHRHGLDVSIAGMGIGVADINDDHLPDLVMTSTRRAVLMVSEPEVGWYDGAAVAGLFFDDVAHIEAWATDFADIDNDADLDVPMMFGWLFGEPENPDNYSQPDAFFLNDGTNSWTNVAADWGLDDRGIGRGMLAVDLDGDGWLDLLKRELGGGFKAYKAVCGEANWTNVRLAHPAPNTTAIGAVIELTVGEVVQRRWVLGAGTSLASNAVAGQHFGLGEAERIDRLRVIWPDGETSTWTDLPVRVPLVLERP